MIKSENKFRPRFAWGGRAPQNCFQFPLQMVGGKFHLFLATALEGEEGDTGDGRILQLAAKFDFLFVKTVEVVAARILDGRMKWRESLDNHFALDIAAAGPAGDLRQQLEGALARAKIRLMQRRIGVNDADERDVWKMEAFCNHLCAD